MQRYFKMALLLSLILSVFGLAIADTVQIGTGTTTTSTFPIHGLYNYSYSQQIYTQAQINTAGQINAIRFYHSSGSGTDSWDWTVYMAHTSRNSFSGNTDWEDPANLVQVFSGDIRPLLPAMGIWMEITLDTPFMYNNSDNLIIAVKENSPDYTSMVWGGFTSGTNTGIYYSEDPNPIDLTALPTAKGVSSTLSRLQLIFPNTSAPNAPLLSLPANNATNLDNPVLSWNDALNGGDAEAYDLYFGTSTNPPLVASDLVTRSYTIENWSYSTTYYWNVVAKNMIGSSPASETWSFTTREDPTKPLPYHQDFNSGTSLTAIEWAGNMLIASNHGVDGSNGLYRNLYSGVTSAYAETPPIGPLASSMQILFDYRYVLYSNYPSNPFTLGENDKLEVQLAYGNGAFSTIYTVDSTNHTTSADFASLVIPIHVAGGTSIKVKFLATWGSGDYYLDIDNVVVRETPQGGVLTVNPSPVNFGNIYLGVTKTQSIALSNTGITPINVTGISLSDNLNFSLANLPAFPLQLAVGDTPVQFELAFTPSVEGVINADLLFAGEQNVSVAINGTGVEAAAGEICENPYLIGLPLVDYLGSSVGLNNDYSSAMFTGVTSGSYLNGKDWVGKVSIPELGNLSINVQDQSGYSSQYMGVFLIDSIPSLAAPAAVLGQAYGTAPLNIAEQTVSAGDYYIIISNWPTPNEFYFKLNVSFVAASEPPAAAVLVTPLNGATNVSLTPSLSWNTGGGTVEKYFVSYGTVEPYSVIVEEHDNELLRTYVPDALAYGTEYWWSVKPWNSVGGYTLDVPQWTFTTLPDPTISSFPWTEDFEGTTFPPANWMRLTGLYPTDTPATYTGGWFSGNFANISSPANKSSRINIYGTSVKHWLTTPPIAIPAEGYELKFDLALTTYNGSNPVDPTQQMDDRFIVLISDSPMMANATVLREWNNSGSNDVYNNIATLGQNVSIDLSAYTGTKYIAFYGESTVTGGDNNLYVDNVTVREIPANPILVYSPSEMDFGSLMHDTQSEAKNLVISNNGGGSIALDANDISIFGADAADFSFDGSVLPVALGPGASVNIPVYASSTAEGDISATLRIVYNGDNYDVALSANVLPAGLVIIGDGTATSRFPLGSYFGYERSAALYKTDEIGAGNKRISSLGWYTTLASNDLVPTKIYLKTYANDTITSDTWANLIAGATPVYDANITSIPAGDWYLIDLDYSFDLDSGNNLLVLVERNYGGSGGSAGSSAPAILATTLTGMHHTLLADTSMPTGSSTAQSTRPNLMLIATDYEIMDPPSPAIVVSPLDDADAVSITTQLSWVSGGGGPIGYRLYFGTENPPAFVADLAAQTSYNPGTLQYESTYYWQVIPYNASGDAVECPVWSFTTMDNPTVMLPAFFDFTGETAGAMPANWSRTHANWSLVATSNAGGSSPELRMYWNPSVDAQVLAITPPLYGENEGGYRLSFKHKVDHYSAGDPYTLKVLASTDMANWRTMWSVVPTASVTEEVETQITLPAYIGTPFYLAWAFDGNTYDINNWYVDDISISSIVSGPPALPVLLSPETGATNMPKTGFELSWMPNLNDGGVPDYYVVFIATDEDEILDQEFFETEDTHFNPVTDGGMVFNYNDRWYWTVLAVNSHGEALADQLYRFDIEDDPTITEFPWIDGFESYENFTLDLRPWSQYDGDGLSTYSIENYTFPNQNYTGSYIVLNPGASTPALPGTWAAHSGDKYAAAFDANGDANDDWLITPPIQSPGALNFSFWARSITDTYGLERFNVLVSTTDTNPNSFTKINDGSYIEAPTVWTKYEYPLNYPDQTIYVAIQCVSDDAFAFFVDDVEIRIPQSIDLAVNYLSGDASGQVNSPAYFDVTVVNAGLNDVANYYVYLKDAADDSVLAYEIVNENLIAGTSVVHEISWTPTQEGTYIVYADVFTAGDTNADNDSSSLVSITVYSENMNLLYVGDPSSTTGTTAFPFNFYYEDFVAETIYLASEIQATSGTIEALQYVCQFPETDASGFQIWMKNTELNNLSAGWLPFDGYTLVYEGTIGSVAGLNAIQIPITPFAYTGGNLAIRTSRIWEGEWASNRLWLITMDTNYPNRTRYYQADSSTLNHENPSGGTLVSNIPNLVFFLDSNALVTNVDTPLVQINKTNSQINVEWDFVDYAYSYNVYRSTDPYSFGDTPFTTVYTDSYSFTPGAADKAYFYTVSAATYRDYARNSFTQRPLANSSLNPVEEMLKTTIKIKRSVR